MLFFKNASTVRLSKNSMLAVSGPFPIHSLSVLFASANEGLKVVLRALVGVSLLSYNHFQQQLETQDPLSPCTFSGRETSTEGLQNSLFILLD